MTHPHSHHAYTLLDHPLYAQLQTKRLLEDPLDAQQQTKYVLEDPLDAQLQTKYLLEDPLDAHLQTKCLLDHARTCVCVCVCVCRRWCKALWESGPTKKYLRVVWEKIKLVHDGWRKKGESTRVPNWEEGEQRGEVGEVYCLYHLASNKIYVGMSYYGALERLKTHWRSRNRDNDPCHKLMALSLSPFLWVMWPIERHVGRRVGYVAFHKGMSAQEGWWIRYLESWWPKGLNVASSGGISKIGIRREWNA